MTDPTITKLERLLALAASPNENEARSAAHAMCRIARDKGITIRFDGGQKPFDYSNHFGGQSARSPVDDFADAVRAAHEASASAYRQARRAEDVARAAEVRNQREAREQKRCSRCHVSAPHDECDTRLIWSDLDGWHVRPETDGERWTRAEKRDRGFEQAGERMICRDCMKPIGVGTWFARSINGDGVVHQWCDTTK